MRRINAENLATIKLVGTLGQTTDANGSQGERLREISVNAPEKLGTAIRKLEEQHNLSLPRDSILILVNGIEANALDDLNTIINENDQIVLVPMFHGGTTV